MMLTDEKNFLYPCYLRKKSQKVLLLYCVQKQALFSIRKLKVYRRKQFIYQLIMTLVRKYCLKFAVMLKQNH